MPGSWLRNRVAHSLAKPVRLAGRIVCFSGAGISVESGIPTYRDKLAGLWSCSSPERLETANAFRENPRLVWGWYLWRRQQAALAQPNMGHCALRRIAATGRVVSVITQNVNDLHERAGSPEGHHLHGSLATPKCFACHRPKELAGEQLVVPEDGALIEPPPCGRCNGKLRPGVVWYGEDLPLALWKLATA